jgi:hypothetical protein
LHCTWSVANPPFNPPPPFNLTPPRARARSGVPVFRHYPAQSIVEELFCLFCRPL